VEHGKLGVESCSCASVLSPWLEFGSLTLRLGERNQRDLNEIEQLWVRSQRVSERSVSLFDSLSVFVANKPKVLLRGEREKGEIRNHRFLFTF